MDNYSVTNGDPFNEISGLLDLFYLDEDFNSQNRAVRGSEFCEMLGLFYDLAEADHIL